MYQCSNPIAKRIRQTAFQQLEKYYHVHCIPAIIYVPIIKLLRSSCSSGGLRWNEPTVPIITKAINSQRALGEDFIIRGYLTKDWIPAIMAYQKDKPEQCIRHLIIGIWTILFEAIWETRNNIKHGDDGIVNRMDRQLLLDDLEEWIRNAGNRLGASQQYLIDFPYTDIYTWPNSTLRNLLDILGTASKNYRASLNDGTQPLITTFFQPISRLNDENSQSSMTRNS